MELPKFYVAPEPGVPTPTKREIAESGFLTLKRKPILLPVLAARKSVVARRDRWTLPAGELAFTEKGLAFITWGKRIGVAEQFLGGTLFKIFARVGPKFVEPIVGSVVGEQLVSAVMGTREWSELFESLSKYEEGLEHPEAFFLPINRIASIVIDWEPNNKYGLWQFEITRAEDDGTFATFEILWREEDCGDSFADWGTFTFFLRLSYEQRFFQETLFRRYASAALEIPQGPKVWTPTTLSFAPEFYDRADRMLTGGATSAAIRLEALTNSRGVLEKLLDRSDPAFDLATPSGKLYDLVKSSVLPQS